MAIFASGTWGQTTFSYTGSMQTYVVPAGVNSIQIEAWGAQGQGGNGGLGGYVSGDMTVTPGQTLNIYVGGQDGFNGGGIGWAASPKNGGGASDVRVGGTAFSDRVIVAGGGGAGGPTDAGTYPGGDGGGGTVGSNYAGGAGGAGYGGPGNDGDVNGGSANSSCHSGGAGGGGSTTGGGASCNSCYTGTCGTDGSFGLGGDGDTWENGICYSSYNGTAGGGGGYYGGGGTSVGNCGSGGGGGGSSWTGTLTNQVLTGGQQSGNGQIVITELCAGLTTTVSATEVCEGEEVTLSATSIGTGTITWDNGITDNTPFVPVLGTTTYTATSSDIGDCGFTVDITVHPNPTIDGGSDIVLCTGVMDTVLTATGTADSFSWDNGITDGVAFTPSTGISTYVVTANNVLGNCTVTDTVLVIVGDPSISLVSSDELFGNDGSIELTILSGTAPYLFDWDNDGTGDNDDVEDLSGLAGGTYTVIMTDATGCTTSETVVVNSQLGLNEINSSLTVYPNPTIEVITVQLTGYFEYTIFNALGQVLINGNAVNTEEIDLSEYENGTYYIRLIQNDESSLINIVKQ